MKNSNVFDNLPEYTDLEQHILHYFPNFKVKDRSAREARFIFKHLKIRFRQQ